ncbi:MULTISPECIES: TetR/AcrR family transcriptional regulator [Amycolatopsis]|uniref:TetR/AcrR family transcriptional regulator n=1 Tax=Amycolatopsis albidoflavus TaxID=102226 RepID=A0ABW5HYM2_9PSEU
MRPRPKTPSGSAGSGTRQRILDAAVDMAARTGLRKLSMDEIARTAKVGRATLYLHFSGRENLVSAMIEDQLAQFLGDVREVLERYDDLEDRLIFGFAHAFRLLRANRALRTVLEINPQILHPAILGDSHALRLGRTLVESTMGAEDLPAETRSLFAEHVARMFHTYILIPSTLADLDAPGGAEDFARQFLVPVRNHLLGNAPEAVAR